MNNAERAPTPDGDESLLRASSLRLGYGHRTILDSVDFEVHAGEFWFLIGPNGQGKTTLLRAILGRLAPQAGRITRRGDFARYDRIGFVPQQCSLNPTLPTTVREFVSLGLVGIRASRREQDERLSESLEKVELGGKAKHDYWSLSGGQQQRALVARALIRRPGILVADEPTSGLDLSVETSLLQSLWELNRAERLTVIMVMHDLAVAARFATHVALVHNTRVEAGPAREILCRDKLELAYQVPVDVQQDESGGVTVRLGPSRGPV
jgi:ABC-type Mn2+/Zn2+ transport system ATPase subunit